VIELFSFMSLIKRQRRQYTEEGGWGREPTAFERARDLAADVATSLGRAVCSIAVKPQPTEEERRAQTREERTNGNWNYVAPEKRTLAERVRKARVAALAIAATATLAMLTVESNEEPVTPHTGTGVTVVTPNAVPSAEEWQPSFTDEEKKNLTEAYAASKELWAKRGIDPSQSKMVLVSGPGSSYTCPTGNFDEVITPNKPSAYCPLTDTIVFTPHSLQGWTRFMGAKGATYQLVNHEYGHHIQELTGDVAKQGQADERGADCYAGAGVMALAPTEFEDVRVAILTNSKEDLAHGSGELLAAAFAHGGATGGANGSCRSNNFLVGAVAGS
jgi:predicted metalloprotease